MRKPGKSQTLGSATWKSHTEETLVLPPPVGVLILQQMALQLTDIRVLPGALPGWRLVGVLLPVLPIPPSLRLVNLLQKKSLPAVKRPSAPFLSDVTCVKFKADEVQTGSGNSLKTLIIHDEWARRGHPINSLCYGAFTVTVLRRSHGAGSLCKPALTGNGIRSVTLCRPPPASRHALKPSC